MTAWQSKISVFVGSKVILIPTPDPIKGEVKPEMFDGPFLEAFFLLTTYQLKSEHSKVFLSINSDLVNQQTLIYLTKMFFQMHKEQITIHKGGLSTRVGPNPKSCRLL